MSPNSTVGYWVLHVTGGPFDSSIELVAVELTGDTTSPLSMASFPTRNWQNVSETNLNVIHGVAHPSLSGFTWDLTLSGGTLATMTYTLSQDTMTGTLSPASGATAAFPLVGVRVNPFVLAPPGNTTGPAGDTLTPLVLLRIDDTPASDRIFIPRLLARGLYGEISVPTRLVGLPDRETWPEVQRQATEGFGIVAHSRIHASTAGSTQQLIGEVVGSLQDLAEQGLPTRVFVQPGTWKDSIDFASPQQLQGWRGALFRTFTDVTEAYARPALVSVPMADSIALGLGHETISDGASKAQVLGWWRQAQQPGHMFVFLVHSFNLVPPDTLDWFLDSLSAGVATGRIRLAHSSAEALTY